MWLAGQVALMGEERKMCLCLVGQPEGGGPFRGPRRKWENGIRMYLREIWGGGDWNGFT
jgi:hypothetical protein